MDERDGGFSLVELLVAMLLFTLIGGVITNQTIHAMKQSDAQTRRAAVLSQERNALDRLGRDLRTAGYPILAAQDSSITVAYTAGTLRRQITWAATVSGGATQLTVDETDTNTSNNSSTTKQRNVVIAKLQPGAKLFTYYAADGSVVPLMTGSTTNYPPTVIQTVKVSLSALLPSGKVANIAQIIDPRNNPGSTS
ncbi:MAG TPA: prepilin-type N-terminal cleavage/methylation domain-containing protein [Mycobacteriales bacterium]|nr:prepilin-type N-terminal cleavage/methylation domain-containing protein [Mycobacteriales bacterium]